VFRAFQVAGAIGLLCCQLFAAGGAAMLYAGPGVTVNGYPALAQEVLPGDKLRIPAKSIVHLNNGSDWVAMAGESEAEYDAHAITLLAGTATVDTKSSMATNVHHFTITPTTPQTKYEVTWHDLHGYATVLEGSINVIGGANDVAAVKGQRVELDESRRKPLAYLKTGGVPKAAYYAAAGGGGAGIIALVAAHGGGSNGGGSKCNVAGGPISSDGSCN
jgi:hypothetical protein